MGLRRRWCRARAAHPRPVSVALMTSLLVDVLRLVLLQLILHAYRPGAGAFQLACLAIIVVVVRPCLDELADAEARAMRHPLTSLSRCCSSRWHAEIWICEDSGNRVVKRVKLNHKVCGFHL